MATLEEKIVKKTSLSKKEYKYRNKIIAENHLNKGYQKYLDEQAKLTNITYKNLYFNTTQLKNMLSAAIFKECVDAIGKMGTSFEKMVNAFNTFNYSLEEA